MAKTKSLGLGSQVDSESLEVQEELEIDDGTGEGGSGGSTEREKKLEKKLTEQASDVAEARVMARLMQDPDLAKVLRAKQAGHKVKVQATGDEESELEPGLNE